MRIMLLSQDGVEPITQPDWPALLAQTDKVLWVDMQGPTENDVRVLRDVFRFHPLTIEDVVNEYQRPKVEEYRTYLFVILNAIHQDPEEVVDFREVDVYIGDRYLVTIHEKPEPLLDQMLALCSDINQHGLPLNVAYLVYVLIDGMVDAYFPIVDHIGEEIEDLTDEVLQHPRSKMPARLFRIRRALNETWRILNQQRDMYNVFARQEVVLNSSETLRYYLRDVHDHLIRTTDIVTTYRETLSNVVELYLSVSSNRLNIVVQRLTVITVAIGVLTVIGGFYGMNFEQTWPPFDAPWGVPFVIGLMMLAVVVVALILGRPDEDGR